MKKYFSSIICRRGYCSAFNTIYKKDASSKVFILSDGDDTERAVFYKKLSQNLRGYSVSLFNPFYDEAADGIFIKNLNTYILSDGGFNKISPALPGEWERYISISENKNYPLILRKEIINLKSAETDFYKKACRALADAAEAKERAHREVSSLLDEEKLINFLHRFCPRLLRSTEEKGHGTIGLLSSATPLGVHTHWDTVFENFETVLSVRDETGFVSSVILGIIKDYAVSEKVPFIMSPAYFSAGIPQFLLFPTVNTAVVMHDDSHPLPFSPTQAINAQRFLKDGGDKEKSRAFRGIEERMLKSSVMSLYEGRDCRFKYNDLIKGYSDLEKAKNKADELAERLIN